MATVVFSTIGQAVGGPLGAALGAATGALADQALFGRRKTQVSDMQIQRSSYGDVLPRLFGTTRQAGVLVWAKPMARSGGKGSGRSAYVMSFAIILSSAPIVGVGRIWADGREVRNTKGDFAFPVKMRVYDGWQRTPDPLIASAEGEGNATSYAGRAYVVFEDFPLGDFGNRIPALSFEVDAGAGEVVEWLDELASGVGVEPASERMSAKVSVAGFSAVAGHVAEDISTLVEASGVVETCDEAGLKLRQVVPLAYSIPVADFIPDEEGASIRSASRLGTRPSGYEIGYVDPERDYQAGVQTVTLQRPGRNIEDYSSLVLTASDARLLADLKLKNAENACETLELHLPWRWLHVGVGYLVALEGHLGVWQVCEKIIDGSGVRLSLFRYREKVDSLWVGESGRALEAPMQKPGLTRLQLIESPVAIFGEEAGPWIVADGAGDWHGADIRVDTGDGERLLGRLADACPQGVLKTPLAAASGLSWNEEATAVVQFDTPVILESRPRRAVLASANLLMIGEEFVQFREAVPLDATSYRVRGLLRGRLATEHVAVSGHLAGAEVRVLQRSGMLHLPLGIDFVGREILLRAVGAGDPVGGTLQKQTFMGMQYGGLGPVHLKASRLADGAVVVSWVSRSMANWSWSGEVEEYPVTLRFLREAANPVVRRTNERWYRFELSEQLATLGEVFSGSIEIVADGVAPAMLRTSRITLD